MLGFRRRDELRTSREYKEQRQYSRSSFSLRHLKGGLKLASEVTDSGHLDRALVWAQLLRGMNSNPQTMAKLFIAL